MAFNAQVIEARIHLHILEGFENNRRTVHRGVLHLEPLPDRPPFSLLNMKGQPDGGGGGWGRMIVKHFHQTPYIVPLGGGTEIPLIGIDIDVLGKDMAGTT